MLTYLLKKGQIYSIAKVKAPFSNFVFWVIVTGYYFMIGCTSSTNKKALLTPRSARDSSAAW